MKKNFLLIILLVFMMIGCVSEGLRQTYGDEWMEANSDWRRDDKKETDTDTKTTVYNSTANIFSQTVSLDSIDGTWGGSKDKPIFTIFLMSNKAVGKVESCNDPKKMPKGCPCFEIQIKGNLSFDPNALNINYSIGVYDLLEMKYINGLAAELQEYRYVTLYLNKSYLRDDCITVYGQDMQDGKGTYKEYCEKYGKVDMKTLIPCTVAFVPTNNLYKPFGRFDGWAADLIMMNEETSYPENIKNDELRAPYTPADINYVIGTVSGSWYTYDATTDNLDSNGCYYYTAVNGREERFKFIIAGNGYDYEIGAEEDGTQSVNTPIPLMNASKSNDIIFFSEEEQQYCIRYYIENGNPYCIIQTISE